jgi:hypothetical protein
LQQEDICDGLWDWAKKLLPNEMDYSDKQSILQNPMLPFLLQAGGRLAATEEKVTKVELDRQAALLGLRKTKQLVVKARRAMQRALEFPKDLRNVLPVAFDTPDGKAIGRIVQRKLKRVIWEAWTDNEIVDVPEAWNFTSLR